MRSKQSSRMLLDTIFGNEKVPTQRDLMQEINLVESKSNKNMQLRTPSLLHLGNISRPSKSSARSQRSIIVSQFKHVILEEKVEDLSSFGLSDSEPSISLSSIVKKPAQLREKKEVPEVRIENEDHSIDFKEPKMESNTSTESIEKIWRSITADHTKETTVQEPHPKAYSLETEQLLNRVTVRKPRLKPPAPRVFKRPKPACKPTYNIFF